MEMLALLKWNATAGYLGPSGMAPLGSPRLVFPLSNSNLGCKRLSRRAVI